jgi:hypothetical protein
MSKLPSTEDLNPFKIGDKVRVVANTDPRLKSYVGKYGKVAGSLTRFSCRVKLVGDAEYLFDIRELELMK